MYHLHVRRHSQGLSPIATRIHDYISREGRYTSRGDVVRTVGSVHLPAWAGNRAGVYWYALDKLPKRSNARLLFTVVVAIPRALPMALQNALVSKFAALLARTSTGLRRRTAVPVSYAIHEGARRDDASTGRRPNPHGHYMVSTSINDGVARSLDLWFCRANKASPSAGGAPRSAVIGGRRWLMRIRRGWAKLANATLRAAGLVERIDHRSHRTRGLAALPTTHLGPHVSAALEKGKPHPLAAKNHLIKKFNVDLVASEQRIRKLTAKHRAIEEQDEAALVLRDCARASAAIELLRQHPFSQNRAALVNDASLLVCDDSKTSGQYYRGDSSELVKRLVQALPAGDTVVPEHDRVWILRDSGDCIAVAGPDFVACDSVAPGIGSWALRIASAIGLTCVVARTQAVNGAMREELDVAIAATRMQCRWEDDSEHVVVQNRRHRQ